MLEQEGLERAYVTSNPLHVEGLLAEQGLTRRVGATVSHILAVPPLIAATDMIAFLPRQFVEQAGQAYGLVAFDPPYASPPFHIVVLSHRTMGAHRSVAWLRTMLHETISHMQSGKA
jgi:DNA-binding transcriptional LysR family regulator